MKMTQRNISKAVSTHSRPKAAGIGIRLPNGRGVVSTHSRPKAAGRMTDLDMLNDISFNTQPPEGGWNDQ